SHSVALYFFPATPTEGSTRGGSGGRPCWQPRGSGFGGVTLKYACKICVTAGTPIVAEPSPRSPVPSLSTRTSICGLSYGAKPTNQEWLCRTVVVPLPSAVGMVMFGPNSAVPVLPAIWRPEHSSRAATLAPSV